MNLKSNPDLSEGTCSKVVWRDTLELLDQGLVRHWADKHDEVLGSHSYRRLGLNVFCCNERLMLQLALIITPGSVLGVLLSRILGYFIFKNRKEKKANQNTEILSMP